MDHYIVITSTVTEGYFVAQRVPRICMFPMNVSKALSETQANDICRLMNRAHKAGYDQGARNAQWSMRQALGITDNIQESA